MDSSRALVCSIWLLLVTQGATSRDGHNVEQRESILDLHEEMGVPDPFMMQREVDWTELFNAKEFPEEQVLVDPPGVLTPGGRQPSFGPRSHLPPSLAYNVQFPLSRPTSNNLQAICLHGDRRPQYPDSYFPASGFSQLKLMATTVNTLESWFGTCCRGNQTWGKDVTLCCTTKAWELSAKSFCREDTSIKRRAYECCKLTGSDMLDCFDRNAENPNYDPTQEIPLPPLPSTANFDFNPITCQRTVMTPYSVRGNRQRKTDKTNRKKEKKPPTSQKIDISFPLGRPTADTIESLCLNQNLRSLYNVKCLRGSGYELLARQAKTINRMEKGFKQCCKKKQDVLSCAERKWTEEVNKFCSHKKGREVPFDCCAGKQGADRYSCFENISPDPHYNMTSAIEGLSLNNICETHKIIKKKFPVGFPLKSFVDQCCPLPEQDKTSCSVLKLEELSATLCSSGKSSPPTVNQCCSLSPQEAPQCISKILMDAITQAINVSQKKKKKRCPI